MTDTVLTLWVLIGSAMILFMHSGFAMIEAGFVRVKNVGTVMINNLTDFAICGLIFWAFGMGFMFNGDSAFFGGWDFVAQADYQGMYGLGVSSISYTVLQACFASTVPAIVGGALLERANFKATLIASCLMTGIVYPVAGHWVWGSGGWLAEWGFHDYAGGAVVHGIGGAIAFVGAAILGPVLENTQWQIQRHAGTQHGAGGAGHVYPVVWLVFLQRQRHHQLRPGAGRHCRQGLHEQHPGCFGRYHGRPVPVLD